MSNARRVTLKRTPIAALAACATVVLPIATAAQVGHPPESTPYRDLRAKRVLSLVTGYLSGSTGEADVGPGDGPFGGARFDIHLGGPASAVFEVGIASLQRTIKDPTKAESERVLGSGRQAVMLADVGIDVLMTGEKTWHGIAPYAGASLGIALGGPFGADSTSGFVFKTNFQASPHGGLWWHLSDRITLHLEARDVIWRLKYPPVFLIQAPVDPPLLDPSTKDDTEWTHHLLLVLGVGYTIGL